MRLMSFPACLGLLAVSLVVGGLGVTITNASKDTTTLLWTRDCVLSNDGSKDLIAQCGDYKHRIKSQSEEITSAIGSNNLRIECRAYRAHGIGGAINMECS